RPHILEQQVGRREVVAADCPLPDAPRHGRAREARRHLTAPNVRPRTRWRCTIRAKTMIGTAASVPAALIAPQSMSMRVISVEAPTGTVCEFGLDVSTSATRNSLYVTITAKIAVATSPGAASGSTTRLNAVIRDEPSTIDASSRSRGISRKKLSIIQTTNE